MPRPLTPVATASDLELHSSERLARLGRALAMLSKDLAESRREIRRLRRENAELRGRLHALSEPPG